MSDLPADEYELLAGLRRRDPEALTALFEAHADQIYRLAMGILGNEADAEEVTQATFISAMQSVDRFEPHARLGTWLYRIAYNHALMLARKRRPEDELPGDDEPGLPQALVDWSSLPEERLLGTEAQEHLWQAISGLPEGLRVAFVLRDVEGLSTNDCAHVQSITESACKVRLHRARLLLRERLSEYFAEWAHAPGERREERR